MIAIGICPSSNGLQFYILANGTFVSSIDYKFQLHTTSGAHFAITDIQNRAIKSHNFDIHKGGEKMKTCRMMVLLPS